MGESVLRFLGFLFTGATLALLAAGAGGVALVGHFSRDLPDYTQLQKYEPPVMTRVHAADGELVAEYARERRLYLPIQVIPKLVTNAFVAAEDKNFYQHGGLDLAGIGRAAAFYVTHLGSGRRAQGASTITQQVAKNFLLTNERSFDRKIKEALLALRMEQAYSKDKILELYVNEIYLGQGAYGVAAASLLYFNKSIYELTVPEAAYLAALPKGPNNYHPINQRARAVERRNYVIDRMVEDRMISARSGEEAKRTPLEVTLRTADPRVFAAEYFAEEVRRELAGRYGEERLYEGGLSVRTTLDPSVQVMARKALTDGLVRYDEGQGWRGPVTKVDMTGDWGVKLAGVKAFADVAPWRLAVVLETGERAARIGLQPPREPGGAVSNERAIGLVSFDAMKWARPANPNTRLKTITRVSQVLQPGDVIYVEPIGSDGRQFRLRQVPEVAGATVVMDPQTGRVLAMVGGFSYDQSQFNRAVQAMRQPGSSFKPIVYAAALDRGYSPASIVMDAPIEIEQGPGQELYQPKNFSANGEFGPRTLRFGIEHSQNLMTIRLAQDVTMPVIAQYAKRLGIYDNMPAYPAYALGAGETTVLRMATAYCMFANGGKRVVPTLIDRIQDRFGRDIFRHDSRDCRGCKSGPWADTPEPTLVDRSEQVLDPLTAYQITSMMEGVVLRGSGKAVKEVGKPVAGKTGTTNDDKDAWFVGFTPNLVIGIYVGFDKPRDLGSAATGGSLAAPIARDLFKMALEGKPGLQFRVPPGIKLVRVDYKTGQRALAGNPGSVILEAFKPDQSPAETTADTDTSDPNAARAAVSPETDRAVGAGGLY
jgi:penicillin-binding protein 1A